MDNSEKDRYKKMLIGNEEMFFSDLENGRYDYISENFIKACDLINLERDEEKRLGKLKKLNKIFIQVLLDRIKVIQAKNNNSEEQVKEGTGTIEKLYGKQEEVTPYETLGMNLDCVKTMSAKGLDDELAKRFLGMMGIVEEKYCKIKEEFKNSKITYAKFKEYTNVIDEERQSYIEAYKKVATEYSRIKLEDQEGGVKLVKREKTPYDIFRITEETVGQIDAKYIDLSLSGLMKKQEDIFKKTMETGTFREQQTAMLTYVMYKNAYSQICNSNAREQYKQKKDEKQRKDEFVEQNNYLDSFKSDLISEVKEVDEENKEVIVLTDKEGKNIRIRQVGELEYKNWTTVTNYKLSKYEVSRLIEGKEVRDTVYLDIAEWELPAEDDKYLNPEYYEYAANELFSEDSLAKAKANFGYLNSEGEINDAFNQEQFSAVMVAQIQTMMSRENNLNNKEPSK